ncbi:hypothetical protein PFISCL1PPCAC_4869, partial [Pristionchus fissidentatus]
LLYAILLSAFTTLASACDLDKVTIEGSVFCPGPGRIHIVGMEVYLTESRFGLNNNQIITKVSTNETGRFLFSVDTCDKLIVFIAFRCDSINATAVINQCPNRFREDSSGIWIDDKFCPSFHFGPQWAYKQILIAEADKHRDNNEAKVMLADTLLEPSEM